MGGFLFNKYARIERIILRLAEYWITWWIIQVSGANGYNFKQMVMELWKNGQ